MEYHFDDNFLYADLIEIGGVSLRDQLKETYVAELQIEAMRLHKENRDEY